jgi:hypothetical protein
VIRCMNSPVAPRGGWAPDTTSKYLP